MPVSNMHSYCLRSVNYTVSVDYVLQRALTLAEGQQRSAFFVLVQSVVVQLRALSRTYSSRALVSCEFFLMINIGFNMNGIVSGALVGQTL